MLKNEKINEPQNSSFLKNVVISWWFLPEMSEKYKEVLVVFKCFETPVQAFYDGKNWRGSFEVQDVMKDENVNNSILCMQEDIYTWCELPTKPNCQ